MVEIIKTAISWVTLVRILQGIFSVIALGVSAGGTCNSIIVLNIVFSSRSMLIVPQH